MTIAARPESAPYRHMSICCIWLTQLHAQFGQYLKAIRDNHPKFVLSMDEVDFSTDGILHRKLCDWLLNTPD